MTDKSLRCSSCGESLQDPNQPEGTGVRKIIALKPLDILTENGSIKGTVLMCNVCIELAAEEAGMSVEDYKQASGATGKLLSAREIIAALDEHVIGQQDAKEVLAIAASTHERAVLANASAPDDELIEKANILLMGPTGTGKTYNVDHLARIMGVDFVRVDASKLSATGYVGGDVDDAIISLIAKADGDIERAQKGIIYIDEVDKIAVNKGRSGDVGGEAVQQLLLTMLNGDELSIKNGRETVTFNTRDVLFIASGAFSKMKPIVLARLKKELAELSQGDGGAIGFSVQNAEAQSAVSAEEAEANSKKAEKLKSIIKILENPETSDTFYRYVTTEDLVTFGMIPEFVGRLQDRATLDPLSKEDLINILTKPKNAITKQMARLFATDDVVLEFDQDALEAVANESQKRKLGARGLKSILRRALKPELLDLGHYENDTTIRLTKEMVEDRLSGVTEEDLEKDSKPQQEA